MPAVQKSNNEYERGDIALGAVKPPNNEYGQLAVKSATYDELQLKPPGTDYADARALSNERSYFWFFEFWFQICFICFLFESETNKVDFFCAPAFVVVCLEDIA